MAKSKTEVNFMEHLKPLLPAGGDASELEPPYKFHLEEP